MDRPAGAPERRQRFDSQAGPACDGADALDCVAIDADTMPAVADASERCAQAAPGKGGDDGGSTLCQALEERPRILHIVEHTERDGEVGAVARVQ